MVHSAQNRAPELPLLYVREEIIMKSDAGKDNSEVAMYRLTIGGRKYT